MKCEKCGNEINDEDVFCQNCGWKIERENKVESKDNIDDRKINNSLSGHKKKKVKLICAIASIFVVIIAVIVFFMLSTPKDVKIEAKTLAEEIYNGDVDKYNSANLFVRGYIVRDTRNVNNEDDGYYMLVSDIENWETLDTNQMVVFQYEEGLKDDIGTGSEVVVQGRLKIQEDSPDMSILVGENIEIKERVDPTYTVDFEELNKEYVGKKITISGRMINVLGDGHYLSDIDISHALRLNGLTDDEFASYFKNGSFATVTGVLTNDAEIDVEKIDQNQFTKDKSLEYGKPVRDYVNSYVNLGEEITVRGIFVKNGSYSVPYSIQDDETGQFISLSVPYENIDLDEYFQSGEYCVLTGYISEGGTSYVIDITAIG